MQELLVFTNLPDRDAAERLARAVVEGRVAACANILAPCTSIYRWKDALQQEAEHPVLIKTTSERYAELEALVRKLHPYELPELIAVPIVRGLPDYLQWVRTETQP